MTSGSVCVIVAESELDLHLFVAQTIITVRSFGDRQFNSCQALRFEQAHIFTSSPQRQRPFAVN